MNTNDKLKDLYDRIQTFEVESAYQSSGCTPAGNDIQGVLNIMADVVDALRDSCLANDIQPD